MLTNTELAGRFERHFDGLQTLILGLERLMGQTEDGGLQAELGTLLADLLTHWDEIGDLADQQAHPRTGNRRRQQRIRVLGNAIVRSNGETVDAQGQCVDFSIGGLRLRASKPVTPGQRYELEITMTGVPEPLVYAMKASWCRERTGGEGYWAGFERYCGAEEIA